MSYFFLWITEQHQVICLQESMPPVLRGEMLLDRMGGAQARLSYEQLRKDAQDLEMQIKQFQVKNLLQKHHSRKAPQGTCEKASRDFAYCIRFEGRESGYSPSV